MRTKNSVKNIKYNLAFYISSNIFIFIGRSLFITTLGTELAGLNSLFGSLMGFLNLAELGLSNVITYSLYKPIFDKDKEKIRDIITLYKKIYTFIGIFVFIIGILVSFNLGLFIDQNRINDRYVITYFYIYLITICISYVSTYKYPLLIADQKAYYITKIDGIIKIIKSITQILMLFFIPSYLMWLLLEIIFNIISYILCNKTIRQTYGAVTNHRKIKVLFKEYINILLDVRNMFFHRLGSFIVIQTDNILIAKYLSLDLVARYNNYYMILCLASSITGQIFNGIGASIGNLIAEKNNEKAYDLWERLHTINFYMGIVFCICMLLRIEDFVNIWLGKGFLLDKNIAILMIVNLYFTIMRGSLGKFKDGYGIFWDKYIPMLEAIINFIISFILVKEIGLAGILIGTLISNIFLLIFWAPYVVFKYGFEKNPLIYHYKTIILFIKAVLPIIFTIKTNSIYEMYFNGSNLKGFIILSILNFATISGVYFLFLCKDKSFKQIIMLIKDRSIFR